MVLENLPAFTLRWSNMAGWKMDHRNQWFSCIETRISREFPAMFDDTGGYPQNDPNVTKSSIERAFFGHWDATPQEMKKLHKAWVGLPLPRGVMYNTA